MRAIILTILSVFLLAPLHARKTPTSLPDSILVTPVSAPTVLFQSNWIGKLVPKDARDWFFVGNDTIAVEKFGVRIKKLTQTPGDLFKDCVYFCPMKNMADDKNSHQFLNSWSFLHAAEEEGSNGGVVPASVRFYLDTSHIVTNIDNYLVSDTFPASLVEDYVRPFYFRKYEVTNREYRDFVDYVIDSLIRTRLEYFLPNGHLDLKREYNYHDAIKELSLVIPAEKRFYSRFDLDKEKLIYHFSQKPAGCPHSDIGIYPDTLRWTQDFLYSYNEPMEAMYAWHPAYDNYPVTCLNYWQCLAFLEWKTLQITKSLKGKYNVLCALPSEIEWDYVSTAQQSEKNIAVTSSNYLGTCDASWLTDLMLMGDTGHLHDVYDSTEFVKPSTKEYGDMIYLAPGPGERKTKQPIRWYNDQYSNPLRTTALFNERTWGDFIVDGAFHTAPVQIDGKGVRIGKNYTVNERSKAHFDEQTGICWLDGNVSEWMREDLDENWRGIFSKHLVVLDGPYKKEHQINRDYEKYYYDLLPKHGKLVRGCNWYDERFAMKYGKNVGGTQAKTFCDPGKAHCTLGFRYVIYVSEK